MGIESLGGNPDWGRSISSNEYLVRSTLRAMYNGDGGLSHSWDMIVCDKAVVASRLVRWSLDHSGEWVFMIAWWMCVIGLVIADGMNIWSTLGIRLSMRSLLWANADPVLEPHGYTHQHSVPASPLRGEWTARLRPEHVPQAVPIPTCYEWHSSSVSRVVAVA